MDNTIAQYTTTQKIYHWIKEHDDKKVFIIGYIGLALVLSTFISLFWLVFIVSIHGVLEYIKYKSRGNNLFIIVLNMVWELKLDFALILFSFVICLYVGFILGIAGLSGVARGGAAATRIASGGTRVTKSASRFLVIQRTLRAGLLMLDEAVFTIRGFVLDRNKKNNTSFAYNSDQRLTGKRDLKEVKATDSIEKEGNPLANLKYKNLTFADKLAIILGLASLLLIILAPVITEHNTYNMVLREIIVELRPFP